MQTARTWLSIQVYNLRPFRCRTWRRYRHKTFHRQFGRTSAELSQNAGRTVTERTPMTVLCAYRPTFGRTSADTFNDTRVRPTVLWGKLLADFFTELSAKLLCRWRVLWKMNALCTVIPFTQADTKTNISSDHSQYTCSDYVSTVYSTCLLA